MDILNRKLLLFIFLGLFLVSCDQSILARVYFGPSLQQENVSLIDYDFVTNDGLHFEFVTGQELDPVTGIVFYDASGNVLLTKNAGEAANLGEVSPDKSYLYSVALEEFHSERLIHRVRIGE